MPSKHPDRDELADLAADVLATRAARRVQEHVRDCEECCAELQDAERIRDLLIADDPGPVPEDVWTRIEAALDAEVQARSTDTVHDRGVAPTGPLADGPPAGDRNPAETILASVTVLPTTTPRGEGPADGEVPEPTALATWATRKRNGESRFLPGITWPSTRGGSIVTAAASVLALAGLAGIAGTVIAHLVPENADTYAKSAPANLEPGLHTGGARLAPPVARTDVNYVESKIQKQIRELVTDVGKASGEASHAPTSSSAAATSHGGGPVQLSDPAALQQCLDALGAGNVTPLAVDLARYRKREAAIIVLPAGDGGQEVWVVSRDCRPGADGMMYYRHLDEGTPDPRSGATGTSVSPEDSPRP